MQNRTKIPTPFGIKNSMVKYLLVIIALFFILPSSSSAVEGSWVELNGKVYGAKPDSRGPIGGGAGYFDIKTSGKYVVTTYNELKSAVSSAVSGDVIYIPEGSTIDFTNQSIIYINTPGITIASNRGLNGSTGGLLKKDDTTHNTWMFEINADNTRITGLEMQGPHSSTTYIGKTVHGMRIFGANVEVDNCEVHAFPVSGINPRDNSITNIHHCYIHHCQQSGLGYGIMTKNNAVMTAEYNIFDMNRHHTAGGGSAGETHYIRHNISKFSTYQNFDMHGDGGDGGPAGELLVYDNNYFDIAPSNSTAISIRGNPRAPSGSEVKRNWFKPYTKQSASVWTLYSSGENIDIQDNIYGNGYTPAQVTVPTAPAPTTNGGTTFIMDPATKTLEKL